MHRILALLLVAVCAVAQARPVTLAWDDPGWPTGTTVELEANGVTVSGITGTQATLDVPLVPGEGLFARARAHADGYEPSEWAALTVTYPRDPVAVWADRTEPDVTPVAISNPTLLGQGANTGVASYNVTLSTNPTVGDLIVVLMVFADQTSSVGDSAITDNKGHTYTRQTQSSHALYGSWYGRTEIWTTVCSTTGGTFTITVDPPVTTNMYSATAVSGVSGQAISFVDTALSSNGTGNSVSANIADLTDAGDLVLGVMTYMYSGLTITPGSGWTQLVEIDESSNTYQALNAIWRKPGAAGAYDPAWTISGGAPGWVASGLAILPSAGGTSVGLTGSSSTSSAGSVALTRDKALSGSAASASAGTLSPARERALAGQSAATASGALGLARERALTGSEVASSSGTLTAVSAVQAALTGSALTVSAGEVSAAQSAALAGQASTASAGTVTTALARSISGDSATVAAGTVGAETAEHVQVALSGAATSASAGTLGVARATALSGATSTVASGTVTTSRSATLSGAASTTSAGIAAPGAQVGLSGSPSTIAAGSAIGSRALALSGAQAASAAGALSALAGEHVTLGLTGAAATAAAGTVAPAATRALAGDTATTAAGTATASPALVLSGEAATTAAGLLEAQSVSGVSVQLSGAATAARAGALASARLIAASGIQFQSLAGTLRAQAPGERIYVVAPVARAYEVADNRRVFEVAASPRAYVVEP